MDASSVAARSGLTLVEIVVAVMIFSVITVAVLEGMVSTTQTSLLVRTEVDMATDAEKILRHIGQDVSRSGWHFLSFQPLEDYATTNPAEDRRRLYYPFVLQQSTDSGMPELAAGLPSVDPSHPSEEAMGLPISLDSMDGDGNGACTLRHAARDPALVRLSTLVDEIQGLPGDPAHHTTSFQAVGLDDLGLYGRSFYARSQEMVFLIAANSPWQGDPAEQEQEVLFFDGPSSRWQTPDPATVDAAIEAQIAVLTAGGMSALEAVQQANTMIRDTMFNHGRLGVRRMNEFWPRLPGDGSINNDPVLTAEPDPWDLGRTVDLTIGAPASLDTLDSPGAWIQIEPGNQVSIKVAWETVVQPEQVRVQIDGGAGTQRLDPRQLREYLYAVVPATRNSQAGRLVRCYSVDFRTFPDNGQGTSIGQWISREGDRGFVVDDILSDDVARIVFDTFRTDPRSTAEGRLGLNEVRVRLYMAATYGQPRDKLAFHNAESTFTMRTSNNARSNQTNSTILGTVGVDLAR